MSFPGPAPRSPSRAGEHHRRFGTFTAEKLASTEASSPGPKVALYYTVHLPTFGGLPDWGVLASLPPEFVVLNGAGSKLVRRSYERESIVPEEVNHLLVCQTMEEAYAKSMCQSLHFDACSGD